MVGGSTPMAIRPAPVPLAPKSSTMRVARASLPNPMKQFTEEEWAKMFPHIERLYFRERRRLREVMTIMEQEYKFKATKQMYKRRFAKWGFAKNRSKRRDATEYRDPEAKALCQRRCAEDEDDSDDADDTSLGGDRPKRPRPSHTHTLRRSAYGSIDPRLLVVRPSMASADQVALVILTKVHDWSTSYFEDLRQDKGQHGGGPYDLPEDRAQLYHVAKRDSEAASGTMSKTLALAGALLSMGHGHLAGKAARKAFLMLEDVLQLEGPALLWNLLEVMYTLMQQSQQRLFEMMLAHLSALSYRAFPTAHPLIQVFAQLWTALNMQQDVGTIIERAWNLNSGIVITNFHGRHLKLYHHLLWDECTLRLPGPMMGIVHKWLDRIEGVYDEDGLGHPAHGAGGDVMDWGTENDTLGPMILGAQLSQACAIVGTAQVARLAGASASIDPSDETMVRTALSRGWNLVMRARMLKGDPNPDPKMPSTVQGSDSTIYHDLEQLSGAYLDGDLDFGPDQERVVVSDTGLAFGQPDLEHDETSGTELTFLEPDIALPNPEPDALLPTPYSKRWTSAEPAMLNARNSGSFVTALGAQLVANAKRIMAEIALQKHEWHTAEENMYGVLESREMAHGANDPRVVREMWFLEDMLRRQSKGDEADALRTESFKRISEFLNDIPDDAA